MRILVLVAALLLAVAGALWLADRGQAPPPVAAPTRTEGAGATSDHPTTAPAADGNEQFAPVPAADREPVAPAATAPSVDVARLIAAGVPADAAADVATAFADLRRVAADGVAAADLLQRRIALVLALAPELPARLLDRSIRVQVTDQKAAGAAVATSFTMSASGRSGPELMMTVHGRAHVVRFRVPRTVGPDDRWRALLDGK